MTLVHRVHQEIRLASGSDTLPSWEEIVDNQASKPRPKNQHHCTSKAQSPVVPSQMVSMIYPGVILQGRYCVLKQLGQGGFGQTFEIDDQGTSKVLKILNHSRFLNPESRQKAVTLFQREAQVLSRLQHPGIPKVDQEGYFTLVGEQGESWYCLIMEKIEGQNLKQWLERQGQPIGQDQAITWLKQLVEILTQVHQQDLIHRDIKPENIMIRPDGQLALIDFGAVRDVTDTYLQRQQNNATGTAIIALGYTPPEQAEGKAVLQSDFFALGRTFVYLLTGKRPTDFANDPRTGRLMWRDNAPQVSKDFANIIDYLMATFPGKRPQTSQMILRCLDELLTPAPSVPLAKLTQEVKRSSVSAIKKKTKTFPFLPSFFPGQTPPNPWQKAQLRRTLFGHTDGVRAVAISPNGQILASGSFDKTIKLWSLHSREVIHTLTGHSNRVTCLAFSPDGQTLVSGSDDRTIKLWSLATGELLHSLVGHSDRIRNIAFSASGQTLISSGSDVQLRAVRTGKLLSTLGKRANAARLVACSPDNQIYVIGGLDGTIELWNPHTGKQLRTFSSQSHGLSSMAFSPDGQMLVSGNGQLIELWNLSTGKRLQALSTQSNGITSLAFSPDGQTLAVGSGMTIELWNVQRGKRLEVLLGHCHSVRSVVFSPEGDILVSGSYDKTIKIWQPV